MDVVNFTPKQANTLRKIFHSFNLFMVFMFKIGMGRMINALPAVSGRVMVIKHRGRKSGREYLTPVNYANVDGEIYCTAGFGSIADWYRNILANSKVELWLPEGKRAALAEDISNAPNRLFLMRQVIIASGFAGPMFGINPRKLDNERFDQATKEYRLVHFILGK
ncbi:MAG: hypothetical protein Fur002_17780 [Anaerolineales bacterium]